MQLQDVFMIHSFMRLSSTGSFLYGCTDHYFFFSKPFTYQNIFTNKRVPYLQNFVKAGRGIFKNPPSRLYRFNATYFRVFIHAIPLCFPHFTHLCDYLSRCFDPFFCQQLTPSFCQMDSICCNCRITILFSIFLHLLLQR